MFINCTAAVHFYNANARRAMMLLQESVMKLKSVTLFCQTNDAGPLQKVFAPTKVEVREFSGGFQTFPVF